MNPSPLPVGGHSWAAIAPDGGLSSREALARLGHYVWVESQIFGLLGGWAAQVPELDAKALVAEQAEHAGWRAQRWFELLPATELEGVLPPYGGETAFGLAASLGDGVDRTLEKLAVTHRVLVPRLVGAYTAHLDWAPVVAEGSTRRLLAIALADVLGDLAHGERLLQAAAGGSLERGRVSAAVDALDDAVTTVGGLLGPGSVGVRPL